MTTDLGTSIAVTIRHCCPGASQAESENAADVILAAELNRDTLLRLLEDRTRRVEALVGERDGLLAVVEGLRKHAKHEPSCRIDRPITKCPECGGSLLWAQCPPYLNADQWDAVKAGDLYCQACPSTTSESSRRHFWQGDLPKHGCACGLDAALSLTPQAARERAALFQVGDFALHSGGRSDVKINCDALTDEDLSTLARMATRILPRFGNVEGVPRGGLRFAEALRPYALGGPLLIVDDVLTTGASMEEQRAGRPAVGLVIFARDQAPSWVTSLFTSPVARERAEAERAVVEAARAVSITRLEILEAEDAEQRDRAERRECAAFDLLEERIAALVKAPR